MKKNAMQKMFAKMRRAFAHQIRQIQKPVASDWNFFGLLVNNWRAWAKSAQKILRN